MINTDTLRGRTAQMLCDTYFEAFKKSGSGKEGDELPHPPNGMDFAEWQESIDNRNAFRQQLDAATKRHGWFFGTIGTACIPLGFALAGGVSPRGVKHFVVVKDGQLWHDPHPSRAGLVGEVEEYCILIRIAP